MSIEECEERIAAAELRLSVYRRQCELVAGMESPFYSSLRTQNEAGMREFEAKILNLREQLATLRAAE